MLLFASEALHWSNKNLNRLEKAYNQAFYKIFKTNDGNAINYCKYYMNCLPLEYVVVLRKVGFFKQFCEINKLTKPKLCKVLESDAKKSCNTFNLKYEMSNRYNKNAMWDFFKHKIDI